MVTHITGDPAPLGATIAKPKTVKAGSPEASLAVRVSETPETARPEPQPVAEAKAPDQLGAVVAHINDYLQDVRRDLEFAVNEDTGRVVVTVRNSETGEIVRQIPPEEVMNLVARLKDQGNDSGLFVQERA